MMFETRADNNKDKPQGLKKIFKSSVFWSSFARKKETIDVPRIRTYDLQIEKCQEMYSRLQLERPAMESPFPESQFPLLRSHTMITRSRPPTYLSNKKAGHFRPFSIRSAPAFMHNQDDVFEDIVDEDREETPRDKDTDDEISNFSELDESGRGRKHSKMDPEKLSEHLQKRGLGLPALVKTGFTYISRSQKVPHKLRSKSLPKNPSYREKVKGRARLDQEMANMRALAFCEQQAPKVFRSASANMKNRDVQFMEEELKEHLHREGMESNEKDADDDDASIVVMPINKEELFLRIDAWIEDVESASRGHKTQSMETNNNTVVNQSVVSVT